MASRSKKIKTSSNHARNDWSSGFGCCLGRHGCESHGFQNFIEFLKYLIYGNEVHQYIEEEIDSRLTSSSSTYREYDPHFPVEESYVDAHDSVKAESKKYRTKTRRALSSGSLSEIDGNKEVLTQGLKSSVFARSPPLYHVRVEEALKTRETKKLQRKATLSQYSTAASFGEPTTPRTVITTNDPVHDNNGKDIKENIVTAFDISSPRVGIPVEDTQDNQYNTTVQSPSTDFQIMTPISNVTIPRLSIDKIKLSTETGNINGKSKSKDSDNSTPSLTPKDKLKKTIRNIRIKNLLQMPKRTQAVEHFFPEPDSTFETCNLPKRFLRSIGSSTSRSASSSFTVRSNQSFKKNNTRKNINRNNRR